MSRQAIAGAESGAWLPSLTGALALARALGTTVEDLFAGDLDSRQVPAQPLAPPHYGSRARLAHVFERWVALPLLGDQAALLGFVPANGRLAGPGNAADLWGRGRSIVVAGCDPALPLVAPPVEQAGQGWGLDWWACGSGEALRLLREESVHAAAVHYPTSERRSRLADPSFATIGFARWREGMLLRPGTARGIASLADSVEANLRWVNREPGSQARSLLEQELGRLGLRSERLAGYESEVGGHLQVASAVAGGLADVGIGTEPAALTYGLQFLPLSEEECVILVQRRRLDSPEMRLLLSILGGAQLRRELVALPGYDASILGEEL